MLRERDPQGDNAQLKTHPVDQICSGSCKPCRLLPGVQPPTGGSWVKGAPRQIQTESYVPGALIRLLLEKGLAEACMLARTFYGSLYDWSTWHTLRNLNA